MQLIKIRMEVIKMDDKKEKEEKPKKGKIFGDPFVEVEL